MAAAARSGDFFAFVGVNTHLSDTLGPYGNTSQVKAELDYIGVDQVRDTNAYSWSVGAYAAMARLGIKFDLVLTHNPGEELAYGGLQADIAIVRQLQGLVPGSVVALEGQNEPWNFPDTYYGQATTNWNTVALVQAATSIALADDPALAGMKLLSPSLSPTDLAGAPADFTATADLGNAHAYPYGGLQPAAFVAQALAGQSVLVRGKGAWITEFGYSNTPKDSSYGVDAATQAKNTLNGLLDAFKAGAGRVYLYELLDENANIAPSTPWGALGLFNADGSAKPVAVALHNLSTLLADSQAPAFFHPGTLDIRTSGLPQTASELLFQKSDGTFELVLWNETVDWNPVTQSEVAASLAPVTIDLPSVAASISVFDPIAGALPIATMADTDHFTVSLTDHPIVVQIARFLPVGDREQATAQSPTVSSVSPPSLFPPALSPPPVSPAPASPNASNHSVFRFFDGGNGSHFFTSDALEAARLITPGSVGFSSRIVLETNDFGALSATAAQSDPASVQVYRLFDQSNGSHFYTADVNELAAITTLGSPTSRPDLVYEPSGSLYEHRTPQSGDTAVYRLFDASNGSHLFLSNLAEFAAVTSAASATYRADLKPEGIAFYAPRSG